MFVFFLLTIKNVPRHTRAPNVFISHPHTLLFVIDLFYFASFCLWCCSNRLFLSPSPPRIFLLRFFVSDFSLFLSFSFSFSFSSFLALIYVGLRQDQKKKNGRGKTVRNKKLPISQFFLYGAEELIYLHSSQDKGGQNHNNYKFFFNPTMIF